MNDQITIAWGIPIYLGEVTEEEFEEFEIFKEAWYTNTDGQVIWIYSHAIELDLWEMQEASQPMSIDFDVTEEMQEKLSQMLAQLPSELEKKIQALRSPGWHILAQMGA